MPPRPRNAAATRAAILEAARRAFAAQGFEAVGLRDVAASVGVNAALVIRYFGSKEALFAEALGQGFAVESWLAGADRRALGERLVRAVLAKDGTPGTLDPLLLLLRSATSERAAPLLRAALEEQFIAPLAGWLGGPESRARAGLIAATLLGLTATRSVLGSAALTDADPEWLIARSAPTVQGYIDG